jgi:D-isomer specific 2-hydroxyacid dehydrogenase, catalytic domain
VDDPSSLKYWKAGKNSFSEASPILRKCQIVSLSDAKDPANGGLHNGDLPQGAELVAIGTKLEDFDMEHLKSIQPNVLFVSHPQSRGPLQELLLELPSIEWVHTRSAGIDFVTSKGLSESNVYVTNAKGQFSSTLAEYTMMACSYFAKVRTVRALVVFSICVILSQARGYTYHVNRRTSLASWPKRNPKRGPSTMFWNCGGPRLGSSGMGTLAGPVPS